MLEKLKPSDISMRNEMQIKEELQLLLNEHKLNDEHLQDLRERFDIRANQLYNIELEKIKTVNDFDLSDCSTFVEIPHYYRYSGGYMEWGDGDKDYATSKETICKTITVKNYQDYVNFLHSIPENYWDYYNSDDPELNEQQLTIKGRDKILSIDRKFRIYSFLQGTEHVVRDFVKIYPENQVLYDDVNSDLGLEKRFEAFATKILALSIKKNSQDPALVVLRERLCEAEKKSSVEDNAIGQKQFELDYTKTFVEEKSINGISNIRVLRSGILELDGEKHRYEIAEPLIKDQKISLFETIKTNYQSWVDGNSNTVTVFKSDELGIELAPHTFTFTDKLQPKGDIAEIKLIAEDKDKPKYNEFKIVFVKKSGGEETIVFNQVLSDPQRQVNRVMKIYKELSTKTVKENPEFLELEQKIPTLEAELVEAQVFAKLNPTKPNKIKKLKLEIQAAKVRLKRTSKLTTINTSEAKESKTMNDYLSEFMELRADNGFNKYGVYDCISKFQDKNPGVIAINSSEEEFGIEVVKIEDRKNKKAIYYILKLKDQNLLNNFISFELVDTKNDPFDSGINNKTAIEFLNGNTQNNSNSITNIHHKKVKN